MNNQSREKNIKNENRKHIGKFIILLICSMLIGAIVGGGLSAMNENIDKIRIAISSMLVENAKIFSIGLPVLLGCISFVSMLHVCFVLPKSRKQIEKMSEEEDEEECLRIENRLSYLLWEITVILILNFFGYSLSVGIEQLDQQEMTIAGFILELFVFLAVILIEFLLQSKVVDQVKLLNPDKKGSAFDIGFQKKWLESSDEAELLMTYKAAFMAFRATDMLCVSLWVILISLGAIWKIGLLAAITVLIIWGVMKCVYFHYAIKFTNVK